MIKLKKKICRECGCEKYIFGRGLCQWCYRKKLPPIKKYSQKAQNNQPLTQKECFRQAFDYWQGKYFLTGEKIELDELKAHNCAHVLSKKMYPYFKYYKKNVILLTYAQHKILDQGTEKALSERKKSNPKEDWIKLFAHREALKLEYDLWVNSNKGKYKL